MNVNLNLSPEDFAALSKKAEELGVDSIEEVVRRLALADPEPKPDLTWLQDREPWSPSIQRSRRRCSICSRPGHYASRCSKRAADDPPKGRACSNCGQQGHNVATCRNETAPRKERPAPPPPPSPEKVRELFALGLDFRYPGMLARLGQDTDLEVAVDYGISRQRVHQIRSRLGIDASFAPYTLTDEDVALLGTMSDAALAERLGTNHMRVLQERRKRGIPPFSPVSEKEQKIEQHLDLLGVLSDPKFAEIAGVSPAEVYRYRVKHGVETKVISPKHKDFVRIDRDEVTRLFHEGKTDEQIAEAVGGSPGTITGIRNRLRLLHRDRGVLLTDDEKATAHRLSTEGISVCEVARRMNRPHATIAAFLRRSKG